MQKTAQIVDFKQAKKNRKVKPLDKKYVMDFSKFRKLLEKTKKE